MLRGWFEGPQSTDDFWSARRISQLCGEFGNTQRVAASRTPNNYVRSLRRRFGPLPLHRHPRRTCPLEGLLPTKSSKRLVGIEQNRDWAFIHQFDRHGGLKNPRLDQHAEPTQCATKLFV